MKRLRIFYGWRIVAAGMGITMLAEALFLYGFGAFFIPWRNSFGWSRGLLGGVAGLSRLEGGLISPIAGWLIDRYGPRRMMFVGLGMMGLGFIALSRVNSLFMLYVVFLFLLAAGSSFGTWRPVQVAVANWFIRYRGRAMGLVMAGSGVGGSSVVLIALFINTFGWRTGAIFAGLLVWAVGLPLASFVRHRPEQMGLLPDGERVSFETKVDPVTEVEGSVSQDRELLTGQMTEATASARPSRAQHFWMRDPRLEIDLTLGEAVRSPALWMIAVAYSMWGATSSVVTVHMAAFLGEALDLEYVVALSTLSFFAFASVFGRLGFGILSDYVNIRLLLVVLLLMQAIGTFLISQINSLAQVPIYIIIFAVPYGGTLTLRGVVQGYYFGRRYFGTIGGFINFVNLPAVMATPIWVGWLADVFPDGYRIAFQIISASLVVAAFCMLLAQRPRPPLPAKGVPIQTF